MKVAPHAGAWIEICPPLEVGGHEAVAPHAGAWIEIIVVTSPTIYDMGRSPCGSVD